MCGERDDRDVPRRCVILETTRRLPAVDDWQVEIHENDVGQLSLGRATSGFAVLGGQNLESVDEFEPHLEHEHVVVIVFYVEDSGHDAVSGG
jgi:hypothetical protein